VPDRTGKTAHGSSAATDEIVTPHL